VASRDGLAAGTVTSAATGPANSLQPIGEGGITNRAQKAGDDADHPDTVVVMPAAQEVSDAEIIRRSWGEPERFAVIFDRYHAQIHGYVARRLGHGRTYRLMGQQLTVTAGKDAGKVDGGMAVLRRVLVSGPGVSP
jgi:hypothetical protein